MRARGGSCLEIITVFLISRPARAPERVELQQRGARQKALSIITSKRRELMMSHKNITTSRNTSLLFHKVNKIIIMCQLLGMNSATPTSFSFCFRGFCLRGGGTDIHKDGWGIAIYEGRGLRSFLDCAACASSPVAKFLKEYPTQTCVSGCIGASFRATSFLSSSFLIRLFFLLYYRT